MKRFLFFFAIVSGGVFFPLFFTVFLSSVFAFYFFLPIELIFLGMFLDSLTAVSAPSVFTLGFLGIIICAEFLKTLMERETWFGAALIIFFELIIFLIIYYVIFI